MAQNKKIKHLKQIYMIIGILFCVLFVIKVVCNSTNALGDIFYLLSTGRYIADTKTIPQMNPFTQDPTRKIVIQNWLSCLWDYLLYSKFGEYAFFVFVLIMSAVACFVLYKYISLYTKNRVRKLSIMIFCLVSMNQIFNLRAGLVTFIVLILEQIILKKYYDGQQQKLIWLLPVFSVFLVNHQASYWLFLFIFALPYVVPWAVNMTFAQVKEHFIKNGKLLIALLVSFAAGFINPYGTKSMFYLFYSYSSASESGIIEELASPRIWTVYSLMILAILASMICVWKMKGRKAIPSYIIYLTVGICFLAMMAIKNCWLLSICAVPVFTLQENVVENYNKEITTGQKYIIGIGAVVTLFFMYQVSSDLTYKLMLENEYAIIPYKAVEYLDQYNKEDVKIFSHTLQNNFLEWNGYKVYMDSRPEVYNEKLSGGRDLYDDIVKIIQGTMDYGDFLEKNQFTHVITYINNDSENLNCLDAYMQNCSKYKLVYESKTAGYKLYEKVDFAG